MKKTPYEKERKTKMGKIERINRVGIRGFQFLAAVVLVVLLAGIPTRKVEAAEVEAKTVSGGEWVIVDSRWEDRQFATKKSADILGKTYYQGYRTKSGKLLKKGWYRIDNSVWYFDEFGIVSDNYRDGYANGFGGSGVKRKWYTLGSDPSRRVYTSEENTSIYSVGGMVRIDGKLYYFEHASGGHYATLNQGWTSGTVRINGSDITFRYYVKKDGSLATGWTKIGSKEYFFDYYTGRLARTELNDEKVITKYFTYVTTKPGSTKQTVNLFTKNGNLVTKQGWYNIKDKDGNTTKHYVNKGGSLPHGWKKIKGKKYFFFEGQGCVGWGLARSNKDNSWFVATKGTKIGTKGTAAGSGYSWHKNSKGRWYGKKKDRARGIAVIDGRVYFFNDEGYLKSSYVYTSKKGWVEK